MSKIPIIRFGEQLELKRYVERREVVEAVQFIDLSQGDYLAELLSPGDSWSLHRDFDGNFWLEIVGQKIVRGDFLVRRWSRTNLREEVEIVPAKEFRLQWQEEK